MENLAVCRCAGSMNTSSQSVVQSIPVTSRVTVIGATGKTGRRVAAGLRARGIAVRPLSRTSATPFLWEEEGTWEAALEGSSAAYVTFYPDLAVPGSADVVAAFAKRGRDLGVMRMLLLSGRGEPGAQEAEEALLAELPDSAIVRCAVFMQNFSEDYMRDHVLRGEIRLPAGDVPTPFLDIDDLADIAVAALTDDRHVGALHELTGPQSLTMGDVAAAIGSAAGRDVRYVPVTLEQHAAEAEERTARDRIRLAGAGGALGQDDTAAIEEDSSTVGAPPRRLLEVGTESQPASGPRAMSHTQMSFS